MTTASLGCRGKLHIPWRHWDCVRNGKGNRRGEMDPVNLFSDVSLVWVVGLFASFTIFASIFRMVNLWPKTSKGGSRGSDIMAYEICAGGAIAYLAVSGIVGWFRLDDTWDYDSIDADKIYGRSVYYEDYIAIPMLWYQAWNTVICIMLSEFRDATMIAHHVVTAVLVLFTLHPFMQYYGVFFFGMPELTSVPLVIVDIFKQFPELKIRFSDLNYACRWAFGSMFIVVRLGLWSVISCQYWMETITILQSGTAHSVGVNVFFMCANVFLTGLQWFWGYKIVIAMQKLAVGPSKENQKVL